MSGFGSWFASLRAARGFSSQEALAAGAKVSRSTIQSIERGAGFAQRHASRKERLARVLQYEVWELEEIERSIKRKAPPPPITRGGEIRMIRVPKHVYEGLARKAEKLGVTLEDLLADAAGAVSFSRRIESNDPQVEARLAASHNAPQRDKSR